MAHYLRSLLSRADQLPAPSPSRRDIVVAIGLFLVAIADIPEGVDSWEPATAAIGFITAAALVVRRTRPLGVVAISFGLHFLLDVFSGLADAKAELPIGQLAILTLATYALARWAAWRDVIIGVGMIALFEVGGEPLATTPDWAAAGDRALFYGTAMAIGIALRYRVAATRLRADQVRAEERARIARELHDVVAHHVSAIAVQAAGGHEIATSDPTTTRAVLGRIHDTAAQALVDMREVVSILRDPDELGPLTPQPDLERLTALAASEGPPTVIVEIDGDIGTVPTGIGSAVFRIAQEAITNARRHAVDATMVAVNLTIGTEEISLRVVDDGRPAGSLRTTGFGLAGMDERATLLGGSFAAGPRRAEIGWQVEAAIPFSGAPA